MSIASEIMKITKYKIAGGNPTLLVEDCPNEARSEIIDKFLDRGVDQIAFVATGENPSLTMMGGEMCVNATLAFAKALGRSGKIAASSFAEPVSYSNFGLETSITFPMEFRQEGDIILLPGIGFRITRGKSVPTLGDLPYLCKKFNLPAFGSLNNSMPIEPWIYVKETGSTIKESSCGSGSIAFSIAEKENRILQSTGQIIRVDRKANQFTVTAKVAEQSLKRIH